jgi:hypothetical protein
MFGIVFGIAFFCADPDGDCGVTCSRTRRAFPGRFKGAVVAADENAEREFVDSMRMTVSRIP